MEKIHAEEFFYGADETKFEESGVDPGCIDSGACRASVLDPDPGQRGFEAGGL